jgi:hypothetical protein
MKSIRYTSQVSNLRFSEMSGLYSITLVRLVWGRQANSLLKFLIQKLKNVDSVFRKQVRPTSWIDKVRKVRIVWSSFKVL